MQAFSDARPPPFFRHTRLPRSTQCGRTAVAHIPTPQPPRGNLHLSSFTYAGDTFLVAGAYPPSPPPLPVRAVCPENCVLEKIKGCEREHPKICMPKELAKGKKCPVSAYPPPPNNAECFVSQICSLPPNCTHFLSFFFLQVRERACRLSHGLGRITKGVKRLTFPRLGESMETPG